MKHAIESNRPARLYAERYDALDLEVDHVGDLDPVAQPHVADLNPGSFHAEHCAHERCERGHRSAELPGEDLDQFVELRIGCLLVDIDTESPVSLGHDFRRISDRHNLQPIDLGAVDVTFADVEHEGDPTEVVGGTVV